MLGYKETLDSVKFVSESIKEYQGLLNNKEAFVRLLYLEVRNNLEVLRCVNFRGLDQPVANDPEVLTLLSLLDTSIMNSVFYGNDEIRASETYKSLLQKEGTLTKLKRSILWDTEDNELKGEPKVTLLQALLFVVVKTELLKKLSKLDTDNFLKNLRIKRRLMNVNQRLEMMKRTLETEFKEIKDLVNAK